MTAGINAPDDRGTPAGGRELDLRQVAHDIWRGRVMVVVLVVLGAGLGVGWSTLNTRFVAEGLLLTPEVELQDYKRYEFALANATRLEEFLQSSGQQSTAAAEVLRDSVRNPHGFAEAVHPEFSFTDRDARLFGVTSEGPGELVGIRLRLSEKVRSEPPPVLLLAEYVRDTAISIDLHAAILKNCLDYQTRELELRNEQLDGDFKIEQSQAKATELREILRAIPQSASIDQRQVVSLAKGNERFLSPVAQLVGSQIEVTDLRLAQSARERDMVGASIMRDYYCLASGAIAESISGRAFLALLKDLREKSVEGKDMGRNAVEKTANAIDLQREKWTSKYLSRMRFVAAPEGSQVRVAEPTRAVGALLGAVFGGLGGVLLALLAGWWRDNRESIVARDR